MERRGGRPRQPDKSQQQLQEPKVNRREASSQRRVQRFQELNPHFFSDQLKYRQTFEELVKDIQQRFPRSEKTRIIFPPMEVSPVCIGQQFFGHIRPQNHAAVASRQQCSCLTWAGVLYPCRPISQVSWVSA